MATDTKLTIPTLHLNGSGWNNLSPQYREALEAIRTAKEKIPRPHGRDYYVQENGAFERARAQFEGQMAKLDEVEEELTGILMDIVEQRK